MMVEDYNFDDIRSFEDSEVDEKLRYLLRDKDFQQVLHFLFKDDSKIEQARFALENIHTINELQSNFMSPLIDELILERSTDGQTTGGLENLDKSKSYLFISNHRDILLDSALMNYLIVKEGMNATEIAIGDNLLIKKWIEYALKLNRAFVIRRNLPARELLLASNKVSNYIRENIALKNVSVWIAQSEGRTKDGNDKTQPALLKMLNLSNHNDLVAGFNELRIVPLSISYEIEPCSISKVAELYKKQTKNYTKTREDDFRSMEEGLIRPKGRIHFEFGKPISLNNNFFIREEPISARIKKLAEYIDQQIYRNFKLWPNNYIAEDILNDTNSNASHYTNGQVLRFKAMLKDALGLIAGDSKEIHSMFLRMYVNPLHNQRECTKESFELHSL